MRLKDNSINVHGLSNELLLGLMIVNTVFVKHDAEVRITSLLDYKHSTNSEHYKGDAVDIGSKEFSDELKRILLAHCKDRLNSEYYMILEKEGTVYEHFHLEYDPLYQPN